MLSAAISGVCLGIFTHQRPLRAPVDGFGISRNTVPYQNRPDVGLLGRGGSIRTKVHEVPQDQPRSLMRMMVCRLFSYLWRWPRLSLLRTFNDHLPMSWAHINMLGEYDVSGEKLRDAIGILPLKSGACNGIGFGGAETGECSGKSSVWSNSRWDFMYLRAEEPHMVPDDLEPLGGSAARPTPTFLLAAAPATHARSSRTPRAGFLPPPTVHC